MNRLLLENGLSYFVVVDCVYDEKKYLYLMNEKDNTDIRIVELVDDSIVKDVTDPELLKKIISNMALIIDRDYE